MPEAVPSSSARLASARKPEPSVPSWRREMRALLALATPLTLAYLGSIAISTTDVVMMGWLGPKMLAAGSLGYNLMFPLYLLGLGVVIAVTPMVAQDLGAGEVRGIRRTFRQGLWAAFTISLPFCASLWFGREILVFFQQAPDVAGLAESYLRTALWSITPAFGYITLRSFLTAHSRTKAVVVTQFFAVGLNVLGNYALMFGHFGFPRLELAGAGISTTVVQIVSFSVLLAYVVWQPAFRRYQLLARFWRPDWPRFFELLRVGLPIGLAIVAEATLFTGTALFMGLLGTLPLAAQAIAVQCVGIAFMVPLGISHATMVRVAFYAGAGDRQGVARASWAALVLGLAVMVTIAALFMVAGRGIADLFLDGSIPGALEVEALAGLFLFYAAFAQLADGTQVILAGILRGLKDTAAAMWFAFIGFWGVGLSASYIFGFALGFGSFGIWVGLCLGLASVGVLSFLRVLRAGHLVPWGGP